MGQRRPASALRVALQQRLPLGKFLPLNRDSISSFQPTTYASDAADRLTGVTPRDERQRQRLRQEGGRATVLRCFRVEDVRRSERQRSRVHPTRALVQQIAEVGCGRLRQGDRQEHRRILIATRGGHDGSIHGSIHRPCRDLPARAVACRETVVSHSESWLARKDSNLQSPDPESGALPFGHSPAMRRRGAGRILAHRSDSP